jgi:hypothetical protein
VFKLRERAELLKGFTWYKNVRDKELGGKKV